MIAPTEREFLAELCLVRGGFKVDPEKAGQDWVADNRDKVDAWLK